MCMCPSVSRDADPSLKRARSENGGGDHNTSVSRDADPSLKRAFLRERQPVLYLDFGQ